MGGKAAFHVVDTSKKFEAMKALYIKFYVRM